MLRTVSFSPYSDSDTVEVHLERSIDGEVTIKSADLHQVRSAIWFIAAQPDGPQRLLTHHQKSPNGLCRACSSVDPVRWPCPTASMALLAEDEQRQIPRRENRR